MNEFSIKLERFLEYLIYGDRGNPDAPVPPIPSVPPTAPKPAPEPPKPIDPDHIAPWDTKANIRHNCRALADLEGLDLEQKNTMVATIEAESGFNLHAVHKNYSPTGYLLNEDHGLCQWNSYYHGKEITPDEAENNPEKAVRLMCKYWLNNQRNQWVAYSSKAYLRFL